MKIVYGLLKSKHLESRDGFGMEGKVGKPVSSAIGKSRLNRVGILTYTQDESCSSKARKYNYSILISGLQWYCIERYRATRR